MKKNMIKTLVVAVGVLMLAANSFGATLTTTLASGAFTNLVPASPSGATLVTQIILTSQATNSARINIIDAPTNTLTYTNAAYIQSGFYATNVIDRWTNYFGVVNATTNVGMITYTNTVAASTNSYAVRFVGASPTNTSSAFPVSTYYNNGVWATNTSLTGAATVTVEYQQ